MNVMNDIEAEDCEGAAEDSELFFGRLLELFVRCDVGDRGRTDTRAAGLALREAAENFQVKISPWLLGYGLRH